MFTAFRLRAICCGVWVMFLGSACQSDDCADERAKIEIEVRAPYEDFVNTTVIVVEVVINDAGFRREFAVSMQDVIDLSLRLVVDVPDDVPASPLRVQVRAKSVAGDVVFTAAASGMFVQNGCNRLVLDAGISTDGGADAEPTADSGASADCPDVNDNTVALYRFDNNYTDVVGGAAAQPTGDIEFSPAMCGAGLQFPNRGGSARDYVRLPEQVLSGATAGEVSLWVKTSTANRAIAVLTRDRAGVDGGLTWLQNCEGRWLVRTQQEGQVRYFCHAETSPRGRWHKLRFQFSPAGSALWVDDAADTYTGSVGLNGVNCMGTVECEPPGVMQLSAENIPWILGADSAFELPSRNGAVDHLLFQR